MLARVVSEILALGSISAAGYIAWGVRGRSSEIFGRSVWKGPATRRAIALTFDDGPSESTPKLLDLLAAHDARATFCALGFHARRLPRIMTRIVAEGHEVANHTDTHPTLYLRSPAFISSQLERAQIAIEDAAGVRPRFFRAPYGARWFGLAQAQEQFGLTGLMWTAIARDWRLQAPEIAARIQSATRPGAVLCFHDGRELVQNPCIEPTLAALRHLLPAWREADYEFITASEMFPLPATAPGAPTR
jgi:peptidoglycan/xylan/chitin deacetylase (PgdA/CDA1 family)